METTDNTMKEFFNDLFYFITADLIKCPLYEGEHGNNTWCQAEVDHG